MSSLTNYIPIVFVSKILFDWFSRLLKWLVLTKYTAKTGKLRWRVFMNDSLRNMPFSSLQTNFSHSQFKRLFTFARSMLSVADTRRERTLHSAVQNFDNISLVCFLEYLAQFSNTLNKSDLWNIYNKLINCLKKAREI